MANKKEKDESAGWRDTWFRNNAEWKEEADGKKSRWKSWVETSQSIVCHGQLSWRFAWVYKRVHARARFAERWNKRGLVLHVRRNLEEKIEKVLTLTSILLMDF